MSDRILFALNTQGKGSEAVKEVAQAIQSWEGNLDPVDCQSLALHLTQVIRLDKSENGKLYNSVIRAGNLVGIPMTHYLRRMLREAQAKAREDQNPVASGRARGLAQALAFILSPFTWLHASDRERGKMVRELENSRP